MELFCFSVESYSVQVFFFGGRGELGDQLATALVLKPKQMAAPKDTQNITNFPIFSMMFPHYIHKSRRFSRKIVAGMAQRPLAFQR